MGFLKVLIGLPLLVVVLVFAFVNNDLATFNLWPFYIEVTVSLSVAIVFLVSVGFFWGCLFSWLSHAPIRKDLRKQKKKYKRLSKEQEKLAKEVEGLHENIATLKEQESSFVANEAKVSFGERIKKLFSSNKNTDNA
ncbi:MAG: DUF1049 domain-containing protein [Alphaproteobacteria bacterium]|nr:DUF1049 domain-containing protein [Alphaproteobacteria bacterium]